MRYTIAVLLMFASFAHADGNRVTSGGFEEGATGWGLSAEASLSTDRPHTGQSCLKIARTDEGAYTLTGQRLKLQPGWPYEISAWVRTENLTEGEAGGATLCMEWSKNGQYYEGEYPKGIWGTKDWTLVTAIAKVPADADPEVGLVCYLRRAATGTAWFDDVSVRLVTDYPPVD
ncbi:MAG: carbohydrate binding domain-containing protein, partial [Armatimonadota bacterium]